MNPESKQTAASAVPAPWRRRHSAVLPAAGAAPALIAPPRAHANFLAAMGPVGRAMQRLADAGAKGPAAFLAAAQAAQGELSTLGKTAATASKQLKDALRRAGADVSALDLEIAN